MKVCLRSAAVPLLSRFSRYIPGLTALASLAIVATLASTAQAEAPAAGALRRHDPPALPELATPVPVLPPCHDCSSGEAPAGPAFFLEPSWRGVSLSDLPADVGFDGPSLEAATRAVNPAGMGSIDSVSWVGAERRRLTLMVVGRAPRFDDDTSRAHRNVLGPGGLGVSLFVLEVAGDHTQVLTSSDFSPIEEHALADLSPRLLVSLTDRTLVLELAGLHLRRVLPVGVGALDPVRAYPALSSLTPVTERARVSKTGATLALRGSSWARGLPYIPLEIPWVATSPAPLSKERLYYAETRLAFHAWPGQTFMRGFNSHGCITLRDQDLLEFAAFVFGRSTPLPLTIREEAEGASHPLPHENGQYWRLVNTGTADEPAFALRGMLYYLERLREPIPDLAGFAGRFMDSEAHASAGSVVAYQRNTYKRGRLTRARDGGIRRRPGEARLPANAIPESLLP